MNSRTGPDLCPFVPEQWTSLGHRWRQRHTHLAVGRQKAMVEGGTRMSVKMGRYPAGGGGALCSNRSSTAPLMSLGTSPRMSSSTDTCSSLRGNGGGGEKQKHTHGP